MTDTSVNAIATAEVSTRVATNDPTPQNGLYRGVTQQGDFQIVRYQIAFSALDAEKRSVYFDDQCWEGVLFSFIEESREPYDRSMAPHHALVLSRNVE